MLIKKYKILSLLALVALGYGCEQSAPSNLYEEKGDLYFSGYYFNYKKKPSTLNTNNLNHFLINT